MYGNHDHTKHHRTAVRSLAVILALGVLSAACSDEAAKPSQSFASAQDVMLKLHDTMTFKFVNNPEAGERIEFPGFSIVAPQGEGWIEGPRLPEPDPNFFGYQARIQFVKILPQRPQYGPHTILAKVQTVFLPIEDQRTVAANPVGWMRYRMNVLVQTDKVSAIGRIRIVSQKTEVDDRLGYICYRYDVIMEDRGVSGFPGSTFSLDVHIYECLDPSFRQLVQLAYSQRVPPKLKPFDMSREGEDFLASLKFAESQG